MRKAGDIITALFRENFGPGFMETARSTAGLFSSWTQVVAEAWPRTEKNSEPAAAVHSRIRELERGVLLVEAEHPGWIQILQTKQAELLSAVQRRYPELDIRGIAFRLSREPFSKPVQEEHKIPETPAAQAPQQKNEVNVDSDLTQPPRRKLPRDEELYAALKGLEESVKKRNKL